MLRAAVSLASQSTVFSTLTKEPKVQLRHIFLLTNWQHSRITLSNVKVHIRNLRPINLELRGILILRHNRRCIRRRSHGSSRSLWHPSIDRLRELVSISLSNMVGRSRKSSARERAGREDGEEMHGDGVRVVNTSSEGSEDVKYETQAFEEEETSAYKLLPWHCLGSSDDWTAATGQR